MTDATEPSGLGLLRGVDVETSHVYSNDLIYSEELLNTEGVFWAAAEADAHVLGITVESYLSGIHDRLEAFMSSNYVFDRVELKQGVRELIKRKNEISIALGAKSIGKTKVLQSVVNEITAEKGDVLVVYVNARDQASGSLTSGIKLALNRLGKLHLFEDVKWGEVRESLAELVSLTNEKVATVNNLLEAMHVCGNVEDVIDADINYLHLIIALAKQRKQHPCLIVDEANLCLHGGEREEKIINQFINVTKEDHKMNVILCSSKPSFPSQLEESGLQVCLVPVVQAEEPPPQAIWKFLTEEQAQGERIIGMGKKLAKLCIALAGGNVILISIVVEKLLEKNRAFKGIQLVYSVEGGLSVRKVIESDAGRAILRDLAKVGYTASFTEPTRDLLLEKSVAGLLTGDFKFYSDMKSVVDELNEVLVPSSSDLRNKIAFELQRADKMKKMSMKSTIS